MQPRRAHVEHALNYPAVTPRHLPFRSLLVPHYLCPASYWASPPRPQPSPQRPCPLLRSFLKQVKASGSRYLLVGSYVKAAYDNKDIPVGSYYSIDLLRPPFSVSQPLEVFDEKTVDGKHMLLFDVEKMTWAGM
jgi:hypothetical protein